MLRNSPDTIDSLITRTKMVEIERPVTLTLYAINDLSGSWDHIGHYGTTAGEVLGVLEDLKKDPCGDGSGESEFQLDRWGGEVSIQRTAKC